MGECFQRRIRGLGRLGDVNVGGECAYQNIVYIGYVSCAHIFQALNGIFSIFNMYSCFKGSLKYSIFDASKPNFPVFK